MLHFHKKNHRIGLDIDEVLASLLKGYSEYSGKDYNEVKNFYFSYETMNQLVGVSEDFWLDLEPKFDGHALPFLPVCYISTRSFDKNITERWIERNGFPCVPVIHVGGIDDDTKVNACKQHNVGIFVDDYIKNFQELNANGINTLLLDCCHNRQYNVDTHRINTLYEVPEKIVELGW